MRGIQPDYLLVECAYERELHEPCCICGKPTGHVNVDVVVQIDGGFGCAPFYLVCLSCAVRSWYLHLLPRNSLVASRINRYLIETSDVFHDAMRTYQIMHPQLSSRNIAKCSEAIHSILATASPDEATCILSFLPGSTRAMHVLILEDNDPHGIWLLSGRYHQLEAFLVGMRLAYHLVHRPSSLFSVSLMSRRELPESDDGLYCRYEIVVAGEDSSPHADRLVYFGERTWIGAVLSGISFSLKRRWASWVHAPNLFSLLPRPRRIRREDLTGEIFRLAVQTSA